MFEILQRALLGRRIGAPCELPEHMSVEGITLRRGNLIPAIGGFLSRLRGPAAAVTLRRTIVIHESTRATPALIAHELAHVRQWEHDALFPLRYSLATLRYGYRYNPYEVEARACEANAGHA